MLSWELGAEIALGWWLWVGLHTCMSRSTVAQARGNMGWLCNQEPGLPSSLCFQLWLKEMFLICKELSSLLIYVHGSWCPWNISLDYLSIWELCPQARQFAQILNLRLSCPFTLFRLSFAEFHQIYFWFLLQRSRSEWEKESSEVEGNGFGDGSILLVPSEIFFQLCHS